MVKNFKSICSIILAVILMLSVCPLTAIKAISQTEKNVPYLYNIYQNDMLFEQKQTATLAGKAVANSAITCALTDGNSTVASGNSTADKDGNFTVNFTAPSGSYTEYTVKVYSNGECFATLTGIVFGELWFAGGQSNMQYPLYQAKTWNETNNSQRSEWIRIYMADNEPDFGNGDGYVASTPQTEAQGAKWFKATATDVAECSAVGYYFAEQLQSKLDMPVGILSVSLGGSSIRSWLSRETIENSSEAMAVLNNHKQYISLSNWNEGTRSYYTDLTSNYNAKVYPLRYFKLSGMIWYQGETEVMTNYQYGEYTALLDLLQKEYTNLFNYNGEKLPIIYSQYSSYGYTVDRPLQNANYELSVFQSKDTSSRACISTYDVPLTYYLDAQCVHPACKFEIGSRMADTAENLVYGDKTAGTATLKSYEIKGNSIFVTLDNVGDGIISAENSIKGFAICGEDGVYYSANAEIIGKNTVKVSNDCITEPKSVTYAYSQVANTANLYSTVNGEQYLPVTPFITDMNYSKLYWQDIPWADCDTEKMWVTSVLTSSAGWKNIWDTDNCTYKLSKSAAYEGTNGLEITADTDEYSLVQNMVNGNAFKCESYPSINRDWSNYGSLSFAVKNTSNEDIKLNGVKFKTGAFSYYYAEISGTKSVSTTIPADGEYHIIEVDLNRLHRFDNSTIVRHSKVLDNIYGFELCFSGGKELSVDSFKISPTVTQSGETVSTNIFKKTFQLFKYVFKFFGLVFDGDTAGYNYTFDNCEVIDNNAVYTVTDSSTINVTSDNREFNYYTIKYTSDSYLKCEITYKSGLKKVSEEFYLEPSSEVTAFSSLIDNALDGKLGKKIESITITPLNAEKATFGFYGISTSKRELAKDYIYTQNEYLKIGASLKWGGALSYLEDLDSNVEAVKSDGVIKVDSNASERYGTKAVSKNVNLINRFDTGRLVQQSYYGATSNESYTSGVYMDTTWRYNPVQGGNQFNDASKIIDYKVTENSIYIKCQPMDWAKSADCITPSYMEATYTLNGDKMDAKCRFVDFSGYPSTTAPQELPAFYTLASFDTLAYYGGENPNTSDDITFVKGLGFWAEEGYPNFPTTEKWSAFVGEYEDSFGVGLYSDDSKQVLAGIYGRGTVTNTDPSKDGATSYIAITQNYLFQSFAPYEYTYSITTGTAKEIQQKFTAVS